MKIHEIITPEFEDRVLQEFLAWYALHAEDQDARNAAVLLLAHVTVPPSGS